MNLYFVNILTHQIILFLNENELMDKYENMGPYQFMWVRVALNRQSGTVQLKPKDLKLRIAKVIVKGGTQN